MPVYISILRGINVSGHKLMKMESLRAMCSGMGYGLGGIRFEVKGKRKLVAEMPFPYVLCLLPFTPCLQPSFKPAP
ncbi:MAG: DUF1697 domain-containing protein [Bacteroidetes bacterium]|nr:DUF1697 domain-containing protein [Bacteroidota bacterium]